MKRNTLYYSLNGHRPVPHRDMKKWCREFEKIENRRVALDIFGEVEVSTVFLGIDHNMFGGKPHLFETMVFGMDKEYCSRYSTWKEAEAGHKRTVKMVKAKLKQKGK